MALGVSAKVVWSNILNAPFVYVTRCDMTGCNEIAQPLRRIRIDLVVIRGHSILGVTIQQPAAASAKTAIIQREIRRSIATPVAG
jgi:hypothetical protein